MPRAIIAGAGIAGLAAAIRLARIGWQPLVIERAPTRRSDGYLINLAGDGLAAAERIGILPTLRPHHLNLREFVYFTSRGRRRFAVGNAAVQAMLGPDHLTLMRGHLEAALYDAARDLAEIRFGTQIRAIAQDDDGVHVTLDDDTALEAQLLIGADGLHSGVRELAFVPEPTVRKDLGFLVAAFRSEPITNQLGERTVATASALGRTAAVARLDLHTGSAFLVYRSSDPASELADGPHAAVARTYPDLDWLIPDLSAQLRRADSVYFDTVSQIVLDRWSSGRVVLIGDAAWCLSPLAGAGAALALIGADLLATGLHQNPDIPAALAAWETELRPQAEQRQQAARRNAAHHAPTSRLRAWLGQIPVRLASLPIVTPLIRRRIRVR